MAEITKKARELTDLDIQEVSLVDKAANNKKFLFFKAAGEDKPAGSKSKKLKKKINMVIDTDGTIGGTKISVNKEELKNLRDFSMYYYGDGDDSRAVSISYSKFVEGDDGFSRSETFYLSKGDSKMKVNKDIEKALQDYFGEDITIDFEKVAEVGEITKALGTINEYRGDFPDDLRGAVRLIAKQAVQFVPGTVAEEGNEHVAKAGAKLSKDTMKKITDALNTLKSLVPSLKEKADDAEDDPLAKALAGISKQLEGLGAEGEAATGDDALAKTLEGITKQLAKLEGKSEGEGEDTDLAKSLKAIGKRLATIEKETGVKKSITDQDDNDDDEEGIEKSDTKWPSFQV